MGHKVLKNRAKCRQCGDVIESIHRHDFRTCTCGAIHVDGGLDYLKRGARDTFEDLIDMSETQNDVPSKAS